MIDLRDGRLHGVDHVAVAVRDIDRHLAFFRDRLGLPIVHDEILSAPPVRLLHLDADNLHIQLVQPLGPSRVATFIEQRGEGLHHVCFRVSRIEETLAGLGLVADGDVFQGGRGQPSCFLDARHLGLEIELTELAPRPLAS